MAVVKAEKSVKVYTNHSDTDLPDHVKALSPTLRRRWVEAHNYHIVDNGDSAAAQAYANDNTYMTLAEHNAMAKKGGGAVSKAKTVPGDEDDDSGQAVEDDVDSEEETASEVAANKKKVSASKSLLDTILGGIKSAVGRGDARDSSPWIFYKDASGALRVFVVYSNIFKDKHKEIISEAAHKEYVEWADRTGNYPDLYLWHGGPGTKWGHIDAVDYVDGFAVASGVVDAGCEHIAEALQKQKDNKVSHGFYGLKDASDVYAIYRPFELSPLPAGAEANIWTAISIGSKEFRMPFSAAKKAYFKKSGLTDEQIAGAEASLKSMGEKLKAAGTTYKSDDESDVEAGTGDAGLNAATSGVLVGELTNIARAVSDLAGVVTTSNKEFSDLKVLVEGLVTASAKDMDTRVTEALTARVASAGVGSASAGKVITKEDAIAAGIKVDTGDSSGNGLEWLFGADGMLAGQLGASIGGK